MSDFKNIDKLLHIAIKEDRAGDVLQPHPEDIQQQKIEAAEDKAQEICDNTFTDELDEELLSVMAKDEFLDKVFALLEGSDTIDFLSELLWETIGNEIGAPPSLGDAEELWYECTSDAMWTAWYELKSLIKRKLYDA